MTNGSVHQNHLLGTMIAENQSFSSGAKTKYNPAVTAVSVRAADVVRDSFTFSVC